MRAVSLAIEQMSIPESLLMSAIGILIVFAALVSLIVIIRLFSVVFSMKKTEAPSGGGAVVAAPAAVAATPKVPAKGSVGEVSLNTVDDKTAALLMAIVADKTGAPLNELRFISIKEV